MSAIAAEVVQSLRPTFRQKVRSRAERIRDRALREALRAAALAPTRERAASTYTAAMHAVERLRDSGIMLLEKEHCDPTVWDRDDALWEAQAALMNRARKEKRETTDAVRW